MKFYGKPAANNKDAYDINFLLQYKIKFEQPHARREMPQCSKYQRCGYAKNLYLRQERCVKCTGDYAALKCERRKRSEDVKYVLCNDKHPVNYKKWRVYKELWD